MKVDVLERNEGQEPMSQTSDVKGEDVGESAGRSKLM